MIQITNKRTFGAFIAVIVVIIICAGLLISWNTAAISQGGEVTIEEGQSARAVWRVLQEQAFTSGTGALRYWEWRLHAASAIQAGTYQLEKGELVKDVVRRFMNGDVTPAELVLTYPEGFTIAQMAERTAAKGIGTAEQFTQAATPKSFVDEFPFLASVPTGRDLEGYLFPDTYHVFPDDTPADVIQRMLTNFNGKFSDELRSEVAAQGRTLDDIVIMASIIEREVTSDDDMAKVAGVLWKRFDDGVGLGADATVRYVLDKWDGALTVTDLAVDSPYNTRKYRGLPPGPISNPGLRAIVAAVRPEASDYYYYLSAPSGETIFSRTLEEHNANKAKYLR